ncbi:type III PLP-dependent enzyme domain-containing protein [Streptomyces apricus]|uniref:Type III PLP-dependent enzyme n=1 Tax=Streptomyces apricus TaxID=1828112 RepID=A0A5B0BEC5_9ACTN|nr:type III PLP-dependent enzyme [Streptomyces apricus]KAA0939269.1 type III PLP-dependent enzyme [Streptomyces apricus]
MNRYAELAERFGTPLYVYDLDEVEAARAELFEALPEGSHVYYALKANPHPDIARAVREGAGDGAACRAEISSGGELAAAMEAGFDPADCLYTGPGKTTAELEDALTAGVRTFSTDSVTDVRRVGAAAVRHGLVADCLLRVNGAQAGATTGIRMTGRPSQFGFDIEQLPEALPELRRTEGVRPAGLHFFPLSNAEDEAGLIGEFAHTLVQAATIEEELDLPLTVLDLGGGFAAPYGVPGARSSYPKLRAELRSLLDTHLPGWRDGAPAVAFESGRYLVACAGTLLLGVTNVKESRARTFVVLDGGINAFGGLSGLGRLLPAAVGLDGAPSVTTASLVGPLCTPGDVLGREVDVPLLRPGDVVAVPNAGAYGVSASLLAFLGRPAPAEVVVRGREIVSASRLEYRRSPLPTEPTW